MIKTLPSLYLGKAAEAVMISCFILPGFRTYATVFFFLLLLLNIRAYVPLGFGEPELPSTPWSSDASPLGAFGCHSERCFLVSGALQCQLITLGRR